MIKTLVASAALLVAPILVNAQGSAIVINQCSYDVQLHNTPASGGGQSEQDRTLSPGGSYSQQWTELSNGNGWSLKLSQDDSMSNILQYEYTFHNDGIIWYDLSEVNGNPWDGNWEITATGDCTPRQAAYRYATDDAYGMQSCPDSSSVTVTLCSGDSGSSGSGGSAPPASSPTTTWSSETTPSATTPTTTSYTWAPPAQANNVAPAPSHLDRKKIHRLGNAGSTVTNVQTEYVTYYVTASPAPSKRHQHHARHPHQV